MTTQEDYEEKLTNIEVTKIGEPTMKSFEALRKELQVIARKLKTTLFPSGMTYGFMVLIYVKKKSMANISKIPNLRTQIRFFPKHIVQPSPSR
jgi:hypothetical protein